MRTGLSARGARGDDPRGIGVLEGSITAGSVAERPVHNPHPAVPEDFANFATAFQFLRHGHRRILLDLQVPQRISRCERQGCRFMQGGNPLPPWSVRYYRAMAMFAGFDETPAMVTTIGWFPAGASSGIFTLS